VTRVATMWDDAVPIRLL